MMMLYFSLLQDSGDEALFEDFYKKHNKTVYYVAKNILKTHDLAEDCVQEVFINFAKNFHNIKPFLYDNRVEGLIKVTTRNMAIDIYRKNKRHTASVVDEDISECFEIGEEDFDVCEQMALKEAIDKLPEEIKNIFYLKYVFGYSGSEIAQIMGISEPLVRKRCMIGRQLAQKHIKREEK